MVKITTFDDAISPVEQAKPELRDGWYETQNYLVAINYSIEKLNELPISMCLLKGAHQILLTGVRGEHKAPGEIRKTQNWIGGSSLKDAFLFRLNQICCLIYYRILKSFCIMTICKFLK